MTFLSKTWTKWALALGLLPLLFYGCTKNAPAPVAPLRSGVALSVAVPVAGDVKASLLGSPSNEIYYRVTAAGMTPVTGVAGPYTNSASTGSLNFSIDVPQTSNQLIALQMNNAANHQPLAVGAVLFNPTSSSGANLNIDLGSVIRNCYVVDSLLFVGGSYFSFQNDTLVGSAPVSYDIHLAPSGSGFQITPGSGNSIAFMGNGNLVNFAAAPVSTVFSAGTSIIKAGDVYCVELQSGGFAWMQIINPGSTTTGPSFRFRVNSSLPYFAYERTGADTAASCLTPPVTATPTFTYTPTITFTSTDTFTPTISSTATNSPTVSPTSTPTNSPINSPTPTATNTASNSPTLTPTNSPINSLTPTASNTASNSPTLTPTNSPSATPTPSTTASSGYTDISANIDNGSVSSSTSGQPDLHSVVTGGSAFGNGAPDLVYQFSLSSPKALFFNLCNASFDSVLYLCTDPNNPSGTLVALADDSNYCGNGSLQTTLATGALQTGTTYYLVIDGYSPSDYGPFTLTVTTLSPANLLTPGVTPLVESEPNNDDAYFANATNLGSLGLGSDLVGKGNVKYYLDGVDTWNFTVANDGTVCSIGLDGFDDGTGKDHVVFDLYNSNDQLVDSSPGNTPLDQVADTLAAGNYHVAVYSDTDGSDGDYRLVIHANALVATSTPTFTETFTPTATSTPPPSGADITAYIDSGTPVAGDNSLYGDNASAYYSGYYGSGAYDVVYSFSVTQAQGQRFFFDLNTTSPFYYPILYVLTNPSDPNSVIAMNACASNTYRATLSTRTLAPGTYYVVVDGTYTGSSYAGPFTLLASTYSANCFLTPVATPNPLVTPGADNTTFSDAGYLGAVDIGTDLTAKGSVQASMMYHNLWAFTVQTGGYYTTSLDCFDDGTDKNPVGFDLYQSLGAGSVSQVDSSSFDQYPYYDQPYGPPQEPNQTFDWLSAGVTYFVDVVADECWSDGDYRLMIQGTQAGTPTPSPTDTITPTPTITPTAVPTNTDITALINSGNPIYGDTSLGIDNYSVTDINNYVYGSGANDVAYTFTVPAGPGERLFFTVNTGQASSFYYPILYVLGPNSTTVVADLNGCGTYLQATLATGLLQPGNYTVVVDESNNYYSTNYSGPFSMTVSTFTSACNLSPTATPNPLVTPGVDDSAFTDAGDLGTVAEGADAVGAGTVKQNLGYKNTWHFTVPATGQYIVSLDCFDDGTQKEKIGFDLYRAGDFTNALDVSPDNSEPDQTVDWLSAGDYYVAVYSNDCGTDGDYHLVVQGTFAPTPTPEPIQDITGYINGSSPVTDTTSGNSDSNSAADSQGQTWGVGAPDVTYRFTLTQPQALKFMVMPYGNQVLVGGDSVNGHAQNQTSNFTGALYLRTKANDPSTTFALADGFIGQSEGPEGFTLVTGRLKPGTYYAIMDGSTAGQTGPFSLYISTFDPVCGYVGSAVPVTEVEPNDDNETYTDPTDMGVLSASTTLAGTGRLAYYLDPVDTWKFHVSTDGTVAQVATDCFDDGNYNDRVGFDLYGADGLGGVTLVDSSADQTYPNQIADTLMAGDYFVAVYSNNVGSDGDYRVVVSNAGIATPTATPTITSTPVPPLALFSAQDPWSGVQNVGGVAVNAAGTTVCLSYNFQSSFAYDPHIQVWTGGGSSYSAASTWSTSGGAPRGLAIDPSGYLYMADSNPYSYKYDLVGSSYLASYGYFSVGPSDIAVDSAGNVYVGSNSSTYTIQVFNPGGAYQTAWGACCYNPAVAVSPGSPTTVYVCPSGSSGVYVYSSSGTYLTTWGGGAGYFSPGGLAVAPIGSPDAGDLYVTDMANGRVIVFDPAGNFLGQWGGLGVAPGQFTTPSGIAVDGLGNIYVGDWGDGRVQKFGPIP